MIKAVFTDLDGTLLSPNRTIAKSAMCAVKDLLSRGIEVGMATGRPYAGIQSFIKELDLRNGASICNTGATLVAHSSGRILDARYCPNDDLKILAELARDENCLLLGYGEEELYLVEESVPAQSTTIQHLCHSYPALEHERSVLCMPIKWTKISNAPMNVGRWTIIGGPEAISRCHTLLPQNIHQRYRQVRNEGFSLECLHLEAGKEQRLMAYCESRGWRPEEIFVIGDGDNDVAMLKVFPNSVAMKNATPMAKQAARWQTERNDSDGFAKAIAQYLIHRLL